MATTNSYHDSGAPDGAYKGFRAVNVQTYDESNKKRGMQWEAARRLAGATAGEKFYSLIKLGNKWPMDLKSRVLGYTGDGVIGRLYVMPEGSNLKNGIDEHQPQNMKASENVNPTAGLKDFKLYELPTAPNLTGAVQIGSDLVLEGQQSNQGKGLVATPTGSNRILDMLGREYVLEIESLDSQNISARIEMYNGPLDLPLKVPE